MGLEASPLFANDTLLSRSASTHQPETTTSQNAEPAQSPDEIQKSPLSQLSSTDDQTSSSSSRALQNVLTHDQRAVVVQWMIEDVATNGEKHICSRAVPKFPAIFRGDSKANLQKASPYWRSKSKIIATSGRNNRHNGHSFVRGTPRGIKIHRGKMASGRGRKRSPWNLKLYKTVLSEFDRFRKCGVKFNSRLVKALTLKKISRSTNPLFGPTVIDERSEKPITEHINPRWVFMQANDIVSRSQTGKLMVSPAKRELIERSVAQHLGVLCREFRSGQLDENNVFNADETHFVIDLHNHKTLARRTDEDVKYADVVSSDEGMTMIVQIAGGTQATLFPPMMVLKNENCSYPIRGTPDNVPGVSYRSGPKGWMDSRVFLEWDTENRALPLLSAGRKRVLYLDNCSGHLLSEEVNEALRKINTEVRFFPKNATDSVQLADSFVTQKLKTAWRSRWGKTKMGMIEKQCWVNARTGSGKLANLGKRYFLQLAANTIRNVNGQRDKDGVLYSRKAMIRCGMALNFNGQWEERQLFPKLQESIDKYRDNFNGAPIEEGVDLEGEAIDTDNET